VKRAVLIGPLLVLCVAVAIVLVVRDQRGRDPGVKAEGSDLTVFEAVQAELDREVVVVGYVFFDSHTGPLLCSDRTEAARPACKGEAAVLQGLDASRLAVERAKDPKGGFDAWVDDPVRLQVRARGGTFLVEDVLPER
jgi:hypothetical protein